MKLFKGFALLGALLVLAGCSASGNGGSTGGGGGGSGNGGGSIKQQLQGTWVDTGWTIGDVIFSGEKFTTSDVVEGTYDSDMILVNGKKAAVYYCSGGPLVNPNFYAAFYVENNKVSMAQRAQKTEFATMDPTELQFDVMVRK